MSDSLNKFDLANSNFAALLFDCDGTLADTADLHHYAIAAAVKSLGHEMPKHWYLDRVGLSLDQLLKEFKNLCGVLLDRKDLSPLEEEIFCRNTSMIREIEPVASIVRNNAGKLPMAVVSSSTRPMVMATLEALQLTPYFLTVITVEDTVNPKPAPDGLLKAAQRLGIDPSRCLVFEDSQQGLDAARNAKMTAQDVRLL
jgi:beta-phosphoglucomutase-like phosphatase (HAD superfamily)